MKHLFHDILELDGVHGLVLLSETGKILFDSFAGERSRLHHSEMHWKSIIDSLGGFHEMDLVFQHDRCYLRRTENRFLMISMELTACSSMIKLSCDIILPQLTKAKTRGGFRSFFGL